MSPVRLNASQLTAVESDDPILCCACPGSGKTRVLIARVCRILASPGNHRVLMMTFSRDAADEMLARIRKEKGIAPEQMARVTVGTFHALALRQLREIGRAGKILSEIETRHLTERALYDTGNRFSLEDAVAGIARCKAESEYAARFPELDALTQAYQARLAETGGQDFTDIILRANALMDAGELKPIAATHVLADEFQDIDSAQYAWLMHHLDQCPKPVACAVGDDDQSIYGFRRSLGYQGMMNFVADAGARIVTLDTNYRSTAGIIGASSQLIAYNIDRVPKRIIAARGDGPPPRVIELAPGASQAQRIVDILDRMCAGNINPPPLHSGKSYRFGVRAGQAAVLARTNASLHAIEMAFIELRVPYLRAGRSFWDIPVLQVYLSILQSLIARDGVGLEVAMRWAKMGNADIAYLAEAGGGSVWNYIDPEHPRVLPPTGSPEMNSLVQLGRGWAAKLSEPGKSADARARWPIHGVAAWMAQVMTGVCEQDAEGNPLKARGRRQIRDLDRLRAARDALSETSGDLAARIRRVREGDNARIPRVILSSFHASKGMEWEHVFLVDCYGGMVPKVSESATSAELEEERRVFYVAMTRAKDDLVIFSRKDRPVSEFLVEAGLRTPRIVGRRPEVAAIQSARSFP